jgi:hypothetical protein
VIDAVQVADSEKFVIGISQDSRIQLGITAHSLSQPHFLIDELTRDKYIGIASIAFEHQRFVGVLLG